MSSTTESQDGPQLKSSGPTQQELLCTLLAAHIQSLAGNSLIRLELSRSGLILTVGQESLTPTPELERPRSAFSWRKPGSKNPQSSTPEVVSMFTSPRTDSSNQWNGDEPL